MTVSSPQLTSQILSPKNDVFVLLLHLVTTTTTTVQAHQIY